ncbi:MAG: site-2 protease family protein [Candidatus Woesearchaeota archaeon]
MKTSYNIGSIAGIEINIHISWLLVFALLAWSLATDFFPPKYHFGVALSWILGITASLLLFVSVLVHELAHSLVSKAYKMKVSSITLFFFGGVSNIGRESPNPKTEFSMAIAGPLTSIAIGVVSFVVFSSVANVYIRSVFDYLYSVNFILAAFNLVPGFPLDGGRVLRSALWIYYHDIVKATRVASMVGRLFGYALIAYGFLSIFFGAFGLWYVFLGAFLVFLARAGYEQVLIRERLSTLKLGMFVSEAKIVDPSILAEEFISWCETHNTIYGLAKKKDGYYIAQISDIPRIHRKEWQKTKVSDFMRKVEPVKMNDDLMKVFERMRSGNSKILPVLKSGKLVGIVSEGDIVNHFRIISSKNG